ncbi:MAG: phosphoadenosine phosphosulfate reductase family protein [Candidatus Freyarchaeota archaeon]|nr:phosphoadenosine phosphosulfate reductase family protein [Candidatus Jordarchaeia archaeon]
MGVYLGAVRLLWCMNCGVPLLDEKCSLCGERGVNVNISPPGDARPAFRREIALLSKVVRDQFGVKLQYDGCIVLNKVPYLDHMDEVIMSGEIIGALRFNVFKLDWEFLPKLAGGHIIFQHGGGKWVCSDDGAMKSILQGSANLLGPGVLDCDPEISVGDHVVVVNTNGKVFAVGVAKKSGKEMLARERGVAVKIRERGILSERMEMKRGTWNYAVKANEEALNRFEEKALRFIRNVTANYNRPVTVAFSGGKDSLVTLLLVLKALGKKFKVLFVDTGVEFPETVAYTEELIRQLGLNLLEERVTGDAFWKLVEEFGPPGRDYRICCKGCKLGPLTKLIKENFPDGCLTFIGQRSYESEARFKEPKVNVNPWVPGQIAAYPIKNWTALHVWLYIFREGVKYNPLYEKGLNRIGCWPCPASKLSEINVLRETHEDFYRTLMNMLERWRKRYGYPEEWVRYGFWRWKRIPKGHLELAEQLGVKLPAERPAGGKKVVYRIERKERKEGGVVLFGRFNFPAELARLRNVANMIGEPSVERGEVIITCREGEARIREDGSFVIFSVSEEKADEVRRRTAQVMVKTLRCVGCSECASACKRQAILINWGMAWVLEERCIHCSKCIEVRCTAIYANKGLSGEVFSA